MIEERCAGAKSIGIDCADRRLSVVIPDLAKSAGTLLALGADEIFMSASADLGPLDIQIAHPDREDEVISGLDVAGSLSYLSRFALELILGGGAAVIDATSLPRLEVVKAMSGFAARFLQPCIAKLDPHLTRRAVFQLQVAERYAASMLSERNVPRAMEFRPENAKKMIKTLVAEYPVHEFVISRTEAKALGLPIYNAEQYPLWRMVKGLHQPFLLEEKSIIQVLNLTSGTVKKNVIVADANNAKSTHEKKAVNNGHAKNNQTDRTGANGSRPKPTVPNRRRQRRETAPRTKAGRGPSTAAVGGGPAATKNDSRGVFGR